MITKACRLGQFVTSVVANTGWHSIVKKLIFHYFTKGEVL